MRNIYKVQGKRITLVSLTASHYRKLIYQLLEQELGVSFVFGHGHTTVKQLDPSSLKKVTYVELKPLSNSTYYLKDVIAHCKCTDIVIDDMGILCVSSWCNLIVAKFRRQKVFVWSHGWYGREGFVKKWLKRAYSALSDGMFLYGEYAHRQMIENGFNPQKMHVIHNSLDYDKQVEVRNRMSNSNIYQCHFHNANPVIIFIGRLTKIKKLHLLIKAVSLLKDRGQEYNVVVVGEGEMGESLKSLVDDLHLQQNVWFYGACYDESSNATLLYNADICVSPGNIGLTAMHAMMYGCPCITHNDFKHQMPEFEAIIPPKTGDFFTYNNYSSLAECIERWTLLNRDNRENVRAECFTEIDNNWNPHKQIEIFKKVLMNCYE